MTRKLLTTVFAGLFACIAFAFAPAGKTYITHTGQIWFFSKTNMENIEAHNYAVGSSLNPATGDMAYSLLIKDFQFKKALMQEHFNENYMESEKYPKSTFKGKVSDISAVHFDKDGVYKVTVAGNLTMHGVTKPVTANGSITVKDGAVNAKSTFQVTLKDYNIEIPSVVKDKIAETLDIHVDVDYPKN